MLGDRSVTNTSGSNLLTWTESVDGWAAMPPESLLLWTLFGLSATAVGVWSIGWVVARARLRGLLATLAKGDAEQVIASSKRIMRWPGLAGRAALLCAVAYVNAGRSGDAQRHLARLPDRLRPTGAVHHYLQAAIHADAGDEDRALLHLHDCLHLDGKYALMAARHPELGRLLDRLPAPES